MFNTVDYRTYVGYAGLFAALSVSSACSLALRTNENQCSNDEDCANRGGLMAQAVCRDQVCVEAHAGGGGGGANTSTDAGTGPDFRCVGKVTWPLPVEPQIVVTMQFIDLVAKLPLTQINVHACAKMDVTCANPLGPSVSPDEKGIAAVNVPASFDGYVEVLGVDAAADAGAPALVPMNVFFNPPPVENSHFGVVPCFTRPALAALASVHGNTIDPSLGFLFSGALDCAGKPAAGVSWEPDRVAESTRRFYYVDGLPSEVAVATDPSGYGGLINMPTGTVRLFAKLQATGVRIGETSVFVRAGYITTGFLVPTP
jgi:hypothetical protein